MANLRIKYNTDITTKNERIKQVKFKIKFGMNFNLGWT